MAERRGTKALELWCRRMTEGYPGVNINNMTTSWRDGLAFCAMIHHFRPDLIEFEKLNKSDVYYNNELAFTTAEKYLGIPALLDAEDMATYEVPDRLSILTYLSQFYQAFAAQNSHNRLKRPSPATEKTQIAKTPGPPSKMAHVVGVPRRDPCQKCKLPVFLAERLIVGKKVFHRTCLKCARCDSQLTPGSFYETEVDDEFVCETCPDEEVLGASGGLETDTTSSVQLRHQEPLPSPDTTSIAKSRTVRSSIAERLAFFEQSKVGGDASTALNTDTKLLQKNVCDEEKSKSLQKKETPYKMNSAFSSFMHHDVIDAREDEANSEATSSLATDSLSKQQMDTSDSEPEDELSKDVENRPELPETQPPAIEVATKNTLQEGGEEQQQKTKKFTATAQLQLTNNNWPTEQPAEIQELNEVASAKKEQSEQITTKKIEIESKLTATTTNDNIHNNTNDAENKKAVELVNLTPAKATTVEDDVEVELESMKPNDNNYVTKDETVEIDAQKMSTQAYNVETITESAAVTDESHTTEAAEENVELRTKSEQDDIDEDAETTKRLSVVRARLHQFEVLANNVPDIDKDNQIKNKDNARNSSNNHKQEVTTENLEDEVKLKPIVETTTNSETEKSLKQVPREYDELDVIETRNNVENLENKKNVPMELEDVKSEVKEKTNIAEESKEETIAKPTIALTEVTIDPSIANTTPLDSNTNDTTPNLAIQKDPSYPEDLNPFQSDDDDNIEPEENKENIRTPAPRTTKPQSQAKLNPFDSSDDEIELEKSGTSTTSSTPSGKVPPPRPPPPRISKNPFGEEADDDLSQLSRRSSLNSSQSRKTPVPTPRTNLSQSQNPTPEPTPRLGNKSLTKSYNASPALQNSSSEDRYGSANSLSTPHNIYRNSELRGSNNSLTSSAGGTIRSRKSRKAPAPPPPSVKELFPSSETIDSSKTSTPSSSTVGTPKLGRKKRLAPAPPKPSRLDPTVQPASVLNPHDLTQSKNLHSYPLQSELNSKLSDEEKALLEGNRRQLHLELQQQYDGDLSSLNGSKRVIPLGASLLQDEEDSRVGGKSDDVKYKEHEEEVNVVYRRVIVPPMLDTPTHDSLSLFDQINESHDRQLEKLKDNKEAQNRNRQSQISASSGAEDSDQTLYNKSSHGKWKRRKGPAPALPIPPRKVLQMLPLQEIKHELEIIEVQQQGLEKQGVVLEKMIRDRCEGENGEPLSSIGEIVDAADGKGVTENSKEVEDLILQLFELVNEKNELFRRQAELMYLRRQHRLEQEQADLEYEIRVLMAQPERNKTDSDKAREEALIARMVKVVQLRNDVVECLEMDRLREAEEDMSIKRRLELHTAQREGDGDSTKKTLGKLSKKEKKKQKETKKFGKSKKLDADKDADETELNSDKLKIKKKKRKFIF